MMTRFIKNEMTLKTTLLMWKSMVTSNGLVSCVIGRDEKFQPLMTPTSTSVSFSIIANLYHCISSLSIKHVDASKCRNVWASIITILLHLTMISTKTHGVGSKNKLEPLSLHDASRSSLVVLTEIKHVGFPTPLVVGC
jgi:hypothetical protein